MATETRHPLQAAMQKHELSIRAEFVPFSRSRNFKPSAKVVEQSLNWRVTLTKAGRDVLTTDYQAGIAYCPGYKGGEITIQQADRIARETELGKSQNTPQANILPDPADVLAALLMDSEVLEHPTYEEWAGNVGYDEDSRKGEKIYHACLEIALRMRSGLGDAVLAELREAASDW